MLPSYITPADIADYKANRGVGDGTLARELGTLRAAIRYCRRELGWELPDPTAGRVPRDLPHKLRWLTVREGCRLVAKARHSHQAPSLSDLILVGLHTGLRVGELTGLSWDRVDLGRREVHLTVKDQKSRRDSVVPLDGPAVEALRRRQKHRERHCPTSRWVFTPRSGEQVASVRKAFAAACRLARLTDVTPHTLRHTTAAWIVRAGVPLRTVAEVGRRRSSNARSATPARGDSPRAGVTVGLKGRRRKLSSLYAP